MLVHIIWVLIVITATGTAQGFQRTIAGINYGPRGAIEDISIAPFPQRLVPVVMPNVEGLMDPATIANPLIVQIRLFGFIGFSGDGGLEPQLIDEIFYQLSNPPLSKFNICGVLLLVDSPGGFFLAAEQIFHTINNYKQLHKIPMATYIEGTAASGGYLLASLGDKIFASKQSVVGSIGVIINEYFNYGENNLLLTQTDTGLKTTNSNPTWEILRRGEWIMRGLPWQPWSADEFERLSQVMKTSYEVLLESISQTRPKLTPQKLRDEIGAGIYYDSSALENQLIDFAPTTREQALQYLIDTSGCGDNYRVIELIQVAP